MANGFWFIQPPANASAHFAEAGENGALGQFTDIGGIAIDEEGFVYVSDSERRSDSQVSALPAASDFVLRAVGAQRPGAGGRKPLSLALTLADLRAILGV